MSLFHARHSGPGHLAPLGVHAHILAQQLDVSFQIQQVILDLECQPQSPAITATQFQLGFVRPGQHQSSGQRRGQQVGGLVQVDVADNVLSGRLPLHGHVQYLTGHHAPNARPLRDLPDGGQRPSRRFLRQRRGQHGLIGHVQQTIPGQNGHGFAVHPMIGGLSPAKGVVVHGGQIVVDQGIGVDHFQRTGEGHGLLPVVPQQVIRSQQQHRADAFARQQQTVAHGAAQGLGHLALGGGFLRRFRHRPARVGQQQTVVFQRRLNRVKVGVHALPLPSSSLMLICPSMG